MLISHSKSLMYISIHAPARGATRPFLRFSFGDIFQSTLPRGERRCDLFKVFTDKLFQSTLPRGERRGVRSRYKKRINFNPRSREGSDVKDTASFISFGNFNPRSREGSDRMFVLFYTDCTTFQSTLPRGERPYY